MIFVRVVKGVTLSGLILACNAAGQFFSVPLLMAHWGLRNYGAWVALTNLGSSLTLMNLGVQSYATNQLILATAQGRREYGARLLGSALQVYGVLCLAALGILAAGMRLLDLGSVVDTGGLTPSASASIVLAHAMLAVYAILGGLLLNLLRAGEQLPRQLTYGLVERVLILSIPMGAALLGGSPAVASWAMVAALGVFAALILPGVLRRSPVPVSPSAGSLREGFRLVGPSLFFFGSALSGQLLTTGITLVISNAVGAVAVATFATALMITNALRLIIHQFINVISGEITLLRGREELARVRDWYRLLWKASSAAAIAAATLLCPFGPEVIRLWTRNRVEVDSRLNLPLTLYLVAHAAGLLSAGFGLAMNKQRPIFFVQLGNGAGAIVLSLVLVHKLGLPGIAWSLLLAQAVSTALLTVMNCWWLDQQAWPFLRDTLGRGVPTCVFALAGVTAGYGLVSLLSLFAATLSLAGCLLLTWFTWLNSWERNWLGSRLREVIEQRALGVRRVSVAA